MIGCGLSGDLLRRACCIMDLVWCPLLYLGTKWGGRMRQPALGPRTPYLKLRRMAEAMTRAEKESA